MSQADQHNAEAGSNDAISAPKPLPLWRSIWRRFRKNRINRIAFAFVISLAVIAVFADAIAYNKPLICKKGGTVYLPVVADYLSEIGLYHWDKELLLEDWRTMTLEWAVWPPVRYLPPDIDYENMRATSPFAEQKVKNWHYLGTDSNGRDVLAGMVHGTRISLTIGLVAVSIAGLIGILLGAMAGYFGDNRLQLSTVGILFGALGLILGYFYGFQVRTYVMRDALSAGGATFFFQLFLSCLILFGIPILLIQVARPLHRIPFLGRRRFIWLDIIISRSIEIFSTIPTLLLLITLMAITEKKSIFMLMAVIGLLAWPGVARYMRGEMLRTRSQEFIESARALGFGNFRIIFRHAIPNSIAPVMVVLTFGVANAITLEAALSFLGIGLPDDVVTWGKLLHEARSNLSAWWLSLVPGMAIFLTATAINLIGEGFRDALDPRLRNS